MTGPQTPRTKWTLATCMAGLALLLAGQTGHAQMADRGIPYDIDWDHPPDLPQISLQNAMAGPFRSPDLRLTSLLEAAFELKSSVDVTYQPYQGDNVLVSVTLQRQYINAPPPSKYWVTEIKVEKTPVGVSCTVKLRDAAGGNHSATVDNASKQSILETAIRMPAQPVEDVKINMNKLERVKVHR